MKKISLELTIMTVLWINVLISIIVVGSYDYPFLVGVSALFIITIAFFKFKKMALPLLATFLLLAGLNLIRFSLAFNLYIYIFNIFPMLLLLFLVYKRRNTLRK